MQWFGKVNGAVKTLVFISAMVNMADGFLSPIFALFITQRIVGGSVATVGFAVATYWLVKSVIQLPIARFLDMTDGERDDYLAMIIGGVLFVVTPLLYLIVSKPLELYAVQALQALAGSLYVVPWNSIFTRHVDKFRIGFEWSLNSSALGFGIMATSALGGFLGDRFGFDLVIVLVSLLNAVGVVGMFVLGRYIKARTRVERAFPEMHRHTK